MEILPEKPTKRSAKRVGLKARSLLVLLLLILAILLISWIFGFRPPQNSSSSPNREPESTPFSRTSFPGIKKQTPKIAAKVQAIETIPVVPEHPASGHLDPELKESYAESGIWEFGVGPTWISGILPAKLATEEFASFSLVTALGLASEEPSAPQEVKLERGLFSFRTPCRLSHVYLRVETKERIDLFGPYIFPPWKHQDLGQLAEANTQPWGAIFEVKNLPPDGSVVAIPRPTKGLFKVPITRMLAMAPQGQRQTSSPAIRIADGSLTDKKLGGPWEFFLQRDNGTFLPWKRRSPANNPVTQLRLKNLTGLDEVVFFPHDSARGFLLKRAMDSTVVTLPQSLAPKDQIAYVRFGSQLRTIPVSNIPGTTIMLPLTTSVIFPKGQLGFFTLVEHNAPAADRERIIHRNQVLFGMDHPQDSSQSLRKTTEVREHVVSAEETKDTNDMEATVERVRLQMNPGRYDLMQIQGTLSGGVETIRTIEVPDTKDDFVITTLRPINRRRVIGYLKDEVTKKPVEGAGIQLVITSPNDENSTWLALSDETGEFILSGLPAGVLAFKAHSPHHQVREFEALLGSSGNAFQTLTVFMKPSPKLSITVSGDTNGRPVIDGMVLIRQDGLTLSAPARNGRVSFGALKESSYVAVPYMGSASIPTDDWYWLREESGGLLIEHSLRTNPKQLHWDSPVPLTVKFEIRAIRAPQGPLELSVVHCGEAPYPGIWPNHRYDDVPFGFVELDRLLPGNYRAIATIAGQSDILDFTIQTQGPSVIPLNFEFPKE